jgi:hypothetical protein
MCNISKLDTDDEAFTMLLKIYTNKHSHWKDTFFSRVFHPEIRIRSIATCNETCNKMLRLQYSSDLYKKECLGIKLQVEWQHDNI